VPPACGARELDRRSHRHVYTVSASTSAPMRSHCSGGSVVKAFMPETHKTSPKRDHDAGRC